MVKAIILAAALLLQGCAPAADVETNPSREAVSRAYRDRIIELAPDAVVEFTPSGLSITLDDGQERQLFIDQSMRRIQAGEPMTEVVNGVVATILRPTLPFNRNITYILIRPASFVEGLPYRDEEGRPLSRPFAGELVALLAEDHVDSFRYPPAGEVGEAGDADVIWREALNRTHAEQGTITLEMAGQGIWVMSARWDIAASLVLDDAIWARDDVRAIGDRLAVGVVRDGLLVVDAEDAQAVATVRGFLRSLENDPNFQSSELFIRQDGSWRVYR